MKDAADTSRALHSPPANDNEPHIGMNGKPCRCTPERRAWYTRGCADTCPCHGLAHAECPKAKPCLGALSTGTRNWPFLHVARHLPSLRPDHREQRNPGNGHHGRGGAPRHAGSLPCRGLDLVGAPNRVALIDLSRWLPPCSAAHHAAASAINKLTAVTRPVRVAPRRTVPAASRVTRFASARVSSTRFCASCGASPIAATRAGPGSFGRRPILFR
jgi:hypothetical protein